VIPNYDIGIIPWVDGFGLLAQHDRDGGDSLYRTCLYICLLVFQGEFKRARAIMDHVIETCEIHPGIWARHPDPTQWYSNPWATSRDQYEKLMLALILTWRYGALLRLLVRQVLMLGHHTNFHKGTDCVGWRCFKWPDLPGLGQINNLYRAGLPLVWVYLVATNHTGIWLVYAYLVLCVLDLRFIGDLYFRQKQTWDYDSLMAIDLAFAKYFMVTPVTYISARLYRETDWQERIKFNYSKTENDISYLGSVYTFVVGLLLR
jgi:hypothetical protein